LPQRRGLKVNLPHIERTALVTGATGAIGPTLIRRLLEQGWSVRALARGAGDQVPAGAQLVKGDITHPGAAKAAMEGAGFVFHLAAKLHINNPSPELTAEYHKVNVTGTRNLIAAARDCGVRRFIFFSTINVYGSTRAGTFADESSTPKLESIYTRTKYEAEQIVLKCGIPSVVLRLGAVYGRGMKGNYLRLMESLKRNRFVYVGGGANRRTLVYLNDVCSAAVLAALHPMAEGKIFNVTDGQVHPLREIVTAICGTLGKRPPRVSFPVWPVRITAAVMEKACQLCGKSAFVTPAMIDKVTEDVAVRGEKIQIELGYRPQFDLSSGWSDIAGAESSPDVVTNPISAPIGIDRDQR
jgi:UDP-glucose 4-epimerase